MPPIENFPAISMERLKEKIDRREPVQIVDVRSESSYIMQHIPRAWNIPLERIVDRADEVLDGVRPIVVYGDDEKDATARLAASLLARRKFTNIHIFSEGLRGWRGAGYITADGEELAL